jgi:hypothetical protein
MKYFLLITVIFCQIVAAASAFDWGKPSQQLLDEKFCPLDSLADAMVVQKQSDFEIISDISSVYIVVKSSKRIKIYSDNGLSNAQFKEFYGSYRDIESIKATCYNANGTVMKLPNNDIRDELTIKDKSRDLKIKSKIFAIPGALAGCVIDVFITSRYKSVLFPPVYRFQEDMPVADAQLTVFVPQYYDYNYAYSNRELLKIEEKVETSLRPSGVRLICNASNIKAIEDEEYMPPERNIATEIIFTLRGYNDRWSKIDIASTWEKLLDYYPKAMENALSKSKMAKAIADSLIKCSAGEDEIIRNAFHIVRDRWTNANYDYVSAPSDNIDNLMKSKTLTPEDKSAILVAILKQAGIESEIIWISSDNSDHKLNVNMPTLNAFDYAQVYIPIKNQFLDPGNSGAEIGIIDEDMSNRLACRPTAKTEFFFTTPENTSISGIMIDLKLILGQNDSLQGSGSIAFYNQSAIFARKAFKSSNSLETKNMLNRYLFRKYTEAVDTFEIAPDSSQASDRFTVNFKIKTKDPSLAGEGDKEINLYPGPTINKVSIDNKPPRIYPIYFATNKYSSVYNVEWDLGTKYTLADTNVVKFIKSDKNATFSIFGAYDNHTNKVTMQRQYRTSVKYAPVDYASTFEEIREKMKELDQSSIMVQPR